MAIVALVGGGGKEGQPLHSRVLTRKVIYSKAFVKPEKLSFAEDLPPGYVMAKE